MTLDDDDRDRLLREAFEVACGHEDHPLTREHLLALVHMLTVQMETLEEQHTMHDHVLKGCRSIIRDLMAQQGLLEVVLSQADHRYGGHYRIDAAEDHAGTIRFRLTPKRIAKRSV